MRSFLLVLFFIACTFCCWGLYGPVLHIGQHDMGAPLQPSSLRPFICVGIAYFLIAVIVPVLLLQLKGEKGNWTASGAIWSFTAGAAGAIGALGITLAFKFRGSPIYVMPLVFGLAPVVNTFVTMWMTRTFKQANAVFFAGVIVVAVGAAGVLFFKPTAKNIAVETSSAGSITVTLTDVTQGEEHRESWTAASEEQLQSDPDLKKAYSLYQKKQPLSFLQLIMIPLSVALTALCWGSYGPTLHKGQMKMAGSRLRPLLCVGLAYFGIAVLVPLPLLKVFVEPGGWTTMGIAWSLGAGAAGAIGALGIIMAFNFGGKPIYVMPLVFGGAPVVNTFTTILQEGTLSSLSPLFFASLLLVIGGAVTVLIFAPRPAKPTSKPAKDDKKKSKVASAASSSKAEPRAPTAAPSTGENRQPPANEEDEEAVEETINSEETVDHRPE